MRRDIRIGIVATLVLTGLISTGQQHATMPVAASAQVAVAGPMGAPPEDAKYANEWPAPNGDLYNTRVAHSTISAMNVSKLGVAWTLPLTGAGSFGADFANPLVANGVVYIQDGASDVMAVQFATGKLLWTKMYKSPTVGPNGVTIANGTIYGVTATGVFALDGSTGEQLWYNTTLATHKAAYDIVPQVAYGKVFVSSALTVGGGILYALDAKTGAKIWAFQTVPDAVGQKIAALGAGGAWNAFLIGPDNSVYAGIGNPYLSQAAAQKTPSRQLYTDSIVKLNQATGKLEWYYQAFPNDFHDWDMQISPIYTVAAGHPVVLDGTKGGFVFAFDPATGKLLWKTAVGKHSGHDNDGALSLQGKLQLKLPYTLFPGDLGGVETNMAAADGVVYVPVVDLGMVMSNTKSVFGATNYASGTGEMEAIDIATGKVLWDTKLAQMPFGGATVSNDLVFTTTYAGQVVAFSRATGAIVWKSQLPAGSNSTLAIVGDTILAGAGTPMSAGQKPLLAAYRLGAKGTFASTGTGAGQTAASKDLVVDAAAHSATLTLVAGSTSDNSGFNFNGASKGHLMVSVPSGYKVTVLFQNGAILPHSVVVTAYANRTASSFPLAFPGATTPNATAGVGQGVKQTFTFTASTAGTYAIVCGVPGHAPAGMWDTFTVTDGGAASITITKAAV